MVSPHRARLVDLGVRDSADTWSKLRLLDGLWGRYGNVMNLTGESGLELHVEEAALAGRVASAHVAPGVWLDVGSGGGLPGLVWAALGVPALRLVEPRMKRAAFLEMACARLGRPDVVVEASRLEDLAHGPYALVSARAVWGPADWLERASSLDAGVVLVHDREGDDASLPGWRLLESRSHRGLRVMALRST